MFDFDTIIQAALLTLIFMFGLFIGSIVSISTSPSLSECAKTNNVYKCEYIAVPVEPEHD